MAIFSHVYFKYLVLLFTLMSVPDTEEHPRCSWLWVELWDTKVRQCLPVCPLLQGDRQVNK